MKHALVRIALTGAVCILLMLLVARLHVAIPGGEARGRLSASEIQPAGNIFEGVEVRQEFPAEGTRIRSIELQLATFGRANEGKLTLRVSKLVNGRWQDVALRTMLKRKLVDCAWQTFGFAPALEVKRGQQIALTLRADLDAANAITWWTSPGGYTENHQLLINGEPRDGYAHFSVDYEPVEGMAGYPKMRSRLWRRLTVFLDPLGQAMLAGGFLVVLFSVVHLSMHAPRAQLTSGGERPQTREADGLIDYLWRACTPRGVRAGMEFIEAQRQSGLYQRCARYGSLLLVGICVFALVLCWLARLAMPLHPSADSAILEVAVHDAVRGKLLVGPYSRFGWNHPGPLFFYVLAPLYYLTGRNPVAIHLGMALLNGASVLAAVFVVRKQVGEARARWAAWIAVLFLIGLSPHGLSQFWNPNALAAPLLLFLTLCAATLAGGSSNLIAATLVGSFLIQTHVGTMGVVGVLFAATALGSCFSTRLHGAPRLTMRTIAIAVSAGFIAWLPPLIQALRQDGGNLRKVGQFFFVAEQPARADNLRLSLVAFVRQAAALPFGVEDFPLETQQLDGKRAAVVGLGMAVAAAAAWLCFRRRAWFGAALASVSLLASVLGLVSVTRAAGPLLSYVFWWCAALPVPAWMALGLAARSPSEARQGTWASAARLGRELVAFASVGWFAWSVLHTPLDRYLDSRDAPQVANYIRQQFPSMGKDPIELVAQPSSYTNYSATYATLRRARVNAVVPRMWEGNFGSLHLAPRRRKPRYVAYLLDVGQTWEAKPNELPDAPPRVIGQVQVWLVDRETASSTADLSAPRATDGS